jgi:ribosomal protein S18 acetylase RimI-like enzyme
MKTDKSSTLQFMVDHADVAEIARHLRACDVICVPPLQGRVDIEGFATKIASRARRVEAWQGDTLVGMVAGYCDRPGTGPAFITRVSVLPAWHHRGIASKLLESFVKHAQGSGFNEVVLEVYNANLSAIRLYEKAGFGLYRSSALISRMSKVLGGGQA